MSPFFILNCNIIILKYKVQKKKYMNTHTAPLFTTVCPDEGHVCGYEMSLLRCRMYTLFLYTLQ